jgi:Diacylglycerol acyltransferase
MFNSFCIAKHEKYTPNKIASMSFFHYIPVLNDIAAYFNNIPSDYQSIRRALDTGHSVSIMSGGLREMSHIEPKKIKLYIKKRTGIFKLSLETGRPLIPVLTYGENELFEPYDNFYTQKLNDFLHSRFGCLNIPFVTWKSVYRWYQLSYKPIDTIDSYVGDPIYPTQDDTIDTLKTRYIKAIETLFKDTARLDYTLHIE